MGVDKETFRRGWTSGRIHLHCLALIKCVTHVILCECVFVLACASPPGCLKRRHNVQLAVAHVSSPAGRYKAFCVVCVIRVTGNAITWRPDWQPVFLGGWGGGVLCVCVETRRRKQFTGNAHTHTHTRTRNGKTAMLPKAKRPPLTDRSRFLFASFATVQLAISPRRTLISSLLWSQLIHSTVFSTHTHTQTHTRCFCF